MLKSHAHTQIKTTNHTKNTHQSIGASKRENANIRKYHPPTEQPTKVVCAKPSSEQPPPLHRARNRAQSLRARWFYDKIRKRARAINARLSAYIYVHRPFKTIKRQFTVTCEYCAQVRSRAPLFQVLACTFQTLANNTPCAHSTFIDYHARGKRLLHTRTHAYSPTP